MDEEDVKRLIREALTGKAKAARLWEGHPPGNNGKIQYVEWQKIIDCNENDGSATQWKIYYSWPDSESTIRIKLAAVGRVPFKGNYWLSFNTESGLFWKDNASHMLESKRPDLHKKTIEEIKRIKGEANVQKG